MASPLSSSSPPRIHLLRHGEALHNIDRSYPHRDPPLTAAGHAATAQIHLPVPPDLILISPMTRTIQTALNAFPSLLPAPPSPSSSSTPSCSPPPPLIPAVQIWPALREAHPAPCNQGLPRALLAAKFPSFDFTACPEDWDTLPQHSVADATARAEEVRSRLRELAGTYRNIAVVTHRGFLAFLVQGERFGVCETRTFGFAEDGEEEGRWGVDVDSGARQDFGPTVLVPVGGEGGGVEV